MIIPFRKFKFQQLSTTTNTFNKFLIKDGFFTKNQLILSNVFKNINVYVNC